MTPYRAETDDLIHALSHATGFGAALSEGVFGDLDADTLAAILHEAGKFAEEVVAPLNQTGDREGAVLEDGKVSVPEGWAEAYRRWVEGGWNGLYATEQWGGQGLPGAVNTAVQMMMNAGSMAFAICPTLTQTAVDALASHGDERLKNTFLPKLVSGEWCGTMNLTEPQAGSDLALLRARAERHDDGSYRIFGTKIFITYGDHEMTENIIHLVLARLPDAPGGTRGISLFAVPKFLTGADGTLGARNDLKCLSLEHKLGLHASPTAVMSFGENDGAIGYLIGEEHRGLNCMFTMMNGARLLVGVQGVGVAERAYQQARAYARERKQGNRPGREETVVIAEHPDIRRTLGIMKALIEAARAICLETALATDLAERTGDEKTRKAASARAALLTPIAKAFSTDIGVEVASLGVQIHGGAGYIEETGAAQHLRDARIAPIYEGTNGIQAIDLISRKLPMDDGAVISDLIAQWRDISAGVKASKAETLNQCARGLTAALDVFERVTAWMLENIKTEPDLALTGAVAYQRLFGLTAGAVAHCRGALALASGGNDPASAARVALARLYVDYVLPETASLGEAVTAGAPAVMNRELDYFAGA